jgi:hypothetical protein
VGVEVEHVGDVDRRLATARAPELADLLAARPGRDDLVGHVEPDHLDRDAAREHDVRGLGVAPDVELGGGRDVAERERAAHEADLLDPAR